MLTNSTKLRRNFVGIDETSTKRRRNFDKTSTKLRQDFDETSSTSTKLRRYRTGVTPHGRQDILMNLSSIREIPPQMSDDIFMFALKTHRYFCAEKAQSRYFGLGKSPCGRAHTHPCLLYTSPSPRDLSTSRMPSSA